MTNVVSIFAKTKKNESVDKTPASVSGVRLSDAASDGSQNTLEVQVVKSPGDDTTQTAGETKAKFNDVELANAERLKKLEEQRKKDNQMVHIKKLLEVH